MLQRWSFPFQHCDVRSFRRFFIVWKKRSVTRKTIKTFPHFFHSTFSTHFAPSACSGLEQKCIVIRKRVSQQCVDVELWSHSQKNKHTHSRTAIRKTSVSENNKVINGNDLFWVHLLTRALFSAPLPANWEWNLCAAAALEWNRWRPHENGNYNVSLLVVCRHQSSFDGEVCELSWGKKQLQLLAHPDDDDADGGGGGGGKASQVNENNKFIVVCYCSRISFACLAASMVSAWSGTFAQTNWRRLT